MNFSERMERQAHWVRGDEQMVQKQTEDLIQKFLSQQLERLDVDITDTKLMVENDGITTTYWIERK